MREIQQEGYRPLANARNLTKQQKELGPVSRGFRAMVTPVLDVLRPSRKQNVVGNMRPTGNALGKFSVSNNVIWNPADKLRTTIKEQTIKNEYVKQGGTNRDAGYINNKQILLHNSVIQQQVHILVIIQHLLLIPAFIMQNTMPDLILINKNLYAWIESEQVIKNYLPDHKQCNSQIELQMLLLYNLTLRKDQLILAMLVKCQVEILEKKLYNVVVILAIY